MENAVIRYMRHRIAPMVLVIGLSACGPGNFAPVTLNGQPYGGPYRMPVLATGERVIRVHPGDTLSQLAKRYRVTYGDLVARNKLKNPDQIYVGQRLVLPNGPQDRQTNTVASAPPRPVKTHRPNRDFAHIPPPKLKPGRALAKAPAPRRDSKAAAPRQPEPAAPPRKGFIWPVSGPVVLGYGPKSGGLYNDGINIAAARGTPIRAADIGVVTYVGNELRGFGNLALIKHGDGYVTAYAHMSDAVIKQGQTVSRGQVIGSVGSTGAVDKPQLHFEIRKGLKARDPARYLSTRS